MIGWSRGRMMTYLALKKPNKIKTVVIGNGASDLFLAIKRKPNLEQNPLSECIANYWGNREAELTKRSAIYWADSLNKESRLLLICGTLDKRVDYHQSVIMGYKLQSINYDYQFKSFETGHSFRGKKKELNQAQITWFQKHLKE
jgi:dipeptidyl aminopeptidase/acylaminoacyl peptidase